MQIYTSSIAIPEGTDSATFFDTLSKAGPVYSVLYIDIETTGLSADKNRIYLIGCASVKRDGTILLTQWFDDTGRGERDVLGAFLSYVKDYTVLVHYNGNRFDIPFLVKRIMALGIDPVVAGGGTLADLKSVDLYQTIRPYRRILALEDYKQQTLEHFMGSTRTEDKSGGDLVDEYLRFTGKNLTAQEKTATFFTSDSVLHLGDPDDISAKNAAASYLPEKEELLHDLLWHNKADVEGLVFLTPLLWFPDLFDTPLHVYKAQANRYHAFDGTIRQEILLFARNRSVPAGLLPKTLIANRDSCFVTVRGNEITIKVPLYEEEMKYFYANYRDYYYLPEEDQALHKSISSFVDKSRREQARPETCYTRKTGSYLPEWDRFRGPFFKREYKDKYAFFEFTDDMKKDRQFFSDYASYVLGHILEKKFVPKE